MFGTAFEPPRPAQVRLLANCFCARFPSQGTFARTTSISANVGPMPRRPSARMERRRPRRPRKQTAKPHSAWRCARGERGRRERQRSTCRRCAVISSSSLFAIACISACVGGSLTAQPRRGCASLHKAAADCRSPKGGRRREEAGCLSSRNPQSPIRNRECPRSHEARLQSSPTLQRAKPCHPDGARGCRIRTRAVCRASLHAEAWDYFRLLPLAAMKERASAK